MKKSLLLTLFGFGIIGVNAQITLTTGDIATPTKVIRQANDTMPSVTIGGSGAGQAWNMMALSNHYEDTLTFLPYSAAPNPKFPSANIAVKFGFSNTYAYLNNNASSCTILGSGAVVDYGGGPSNVNTVYSPAEILANWPGTYNSTFTNVYYSKATYYFGVDPGIGIVIDSLRTHNRISKTVLFDGWGTVTTPLGSYPALRAKQTVVTRDSTDAYVTPLGWQNNILTGADSTTSYSWWTNGIGFPLVEISLDSLAAISSASWLQTLPMTVGLNEYAGPLDVTIYPNPAQNELNFFLDSKVAKAIEIYDITGRKVDGFELSSDITTVNTSVYANGTYTFSVTGKDNTIVKRGKFSVAK